jgi:hypothetical protein
MSAQRQDDAPLDPAHEGRGRPTCRRKTAWRNVSSSAMTAESLRARTASHRNKHTMIR